MTVSGWGVTENYVGAGPRNLQAARIPTVSTSVCRQRFPFAENPPLVCGGGPQTPQAGCITDNGGPATVSVDGRRHLLGTFAFHDGDDLKCEKHTSAFSSLNERAVVNWIRSVAGSQCW